MNWVQHARLALAALGPAERAAKVQAARERIQAAEAKRQQAKRDREAARIAKLAKARRKSNP